MQWQGCTVSNHELEQGEKQGQRERRREKGVEHRNSEGQSRGQGLELEHSHSYDLLAVDCLSAAAVHDPVIYWSCRL